MHTLRAMSTLLFTYTWVQIVVPKTRKNLAKSSTWFDCQSGIRGNFGLVDRGRTHSRRQRNQPRLVGAHLQPGHWLEILGATHHAPGYGRSRFPLSVASCATNHADRPAIAAPPNGYRACSPEHTSNPVKSFDIQSCRAFSAPPVATLHLHNTLTGCAIYQMNCTHIVYWTTNNGPVGLQTMAPCLFHLVTWEG